MSKKKPETRYNNSIRAESIRLIDEKGEQVGIVPTKKAIIMAQEVGLDVVEVAPNANPPVCRIMDFGKFKYELSKKEKQAKKKQTIINVKEIRLRPKIEAHDYDFKTKNARKFIDAGAKVKVTVMFRGREMMHKEFGREVLDRMIEDLSDIAKVAVEPTMEGRFMTMYLLKK
ncbi:MAG: translation initiation factor IF-3 [Deferribacteres bacterium]|nr:translation initiation factor IF-3 [candidate division KSB1 bacterium]MCB9501408.1 translation initiation factor IF-3 [Deferribacteres bacterium]